MRFPRLVALAATAVVALVANAASATLAVDAPQTISRQVTVQLIRTALDNGTSPATVFGDATQRASIEAGIDRIWAQAGIDVKFLPNITQYNSTFAYQGNNGSNARNTNDLNTILTNVGAAGLLNSDSLTLNLVMVNVVPSFTPLSENHSAGYARLPGNGITGYVGDNLLTFADGLDVVASVMAHEIGHNLGLDHTADNTPNLMSPGGSTQQLTAAQIATARSSNFARLFSPPSITGDYNGNGIVDAADYVVWRNAGVGTYTEWRSRFGLSSGAGALTGGNSSSISSGAVPEPATLASMLVISTILFVATRRGGRRNR